MWPAVLSGLPRRAIAIAVAVCCAFAAGFAVAWSWQSNKIDAATSAGEAALAALRADYADAVALRLTQLQAVQEAAMTKADEVDREYQRIIESIKKQRIDNPVRIVRVQCPAADPVPPAAARPARDPGKPAAAAADGSGVAADAGPGHIDLNVSDIDALTDEGRVVSARLTALQGLCGK
jgi:hypothetical protein